MRLLLDENISGHTGRVLRIAGYHVSRCPPRTSDPDVLARAEAEGAIVLTRDHDFLNFQPARAGIIYIRIHPSIAQDITEAVRDLLSGVEETALLGKVAILSRGSLDILPP